MSTLTIQLPESLKKTIEDLAAREGYSVSQFLASAAGEKLAVVMTWITCAGKRPQAAVKILKNIWPPRLMSRPCRETKCDVAR